ncbi:uncharacterized protein LOC108227921 isoform X2 [Daucus carota subsp. sativus]|uniref:uncharacterized protein LOC108227921 isoform X2 n=1 Tax=Daucus carota subsp. sativus TaxID=79200 RepID=UPI0030835CEA
MESKRRRSDALLPWFLAIEALASYQTDPSFLFDLVKKIPGDCSENDGKNARELVCLRVLESLSVLENGKMKADSGARISPSDCCEDVLIQVLLKISSRENQELSKSGMLKGDIEQYVKRKISCLPKCGLERLKDVILKDSDVIPLSVKEKSGLLKKYHSDGNATRDERSDRDALFPWFLAIEALTSDQTDPSFLFDLVKKIPRDCSENDGKNARELVCLRVLESLSVLENGKIKADSSARISPSDCGEDVLIQVLLKISSRENQELSKSEMLKGDIEQYVKRKISCLPKCGLEQLKDVILKDSDVIPLSVKEKSGLSKKYHSDGNSTRDERSDCDALDDPPVRDLPSGKTDVKDSGYANQEGSTSLNEKFHVDSVPVEIVQHSGEEESNLLRELGVENLRETVTSENVDSDRVASKKLRMSFTVGDAQLLHNQLQGTCNVEKLTQGTSGEEHDLNIIAGEAKNDAEGYVESKTVVSSPRFVDQGTNSVHEAKDNCDHSLSLTPNSLRCGEIRATVESEHQSETLSDDEILIRNTTFLNSQCSHSQDSLATLNGMKLCMICKIGGQLLVCSSGSCQRVVHERCMGVAPTFDVTRRFYCPFCAYSRAISEYSESKKKYSLARKTLVAFINRDEYRLRNSSSVLHREDQNHSRESEISNKSIEENRLENVVSREIKNSSRKNTGDKPSISCDSSSRKRARAVTSGENEVALEVKSNAEGCQSLSEQEKQVPVLGVQNREPESSLPGVSEQLGTVEKLQEFSHQPKGVPQVENKEDLYLASQAIKDSEAYSSKSKYSEIAYRRKRHSGTPKEQDVSNQPTVSPCEPAKPKHSAEGKSSGERSESTTQHSLRIRKRKQQYSYPSMPHLRRKKILWSNAEEEALKEGVKRFASHHDGLMPWKTILEFGGDVFKNRTAIDLKDKWRNISKASAKV